MTGTTVGDDGADLLALQEASFAGASATTRQSWGPEGRMTGPELAAFLDGSRYAVVSSVRRDGRPHAAPVRFLRRGTTFWLPTAAGTARERSVRRTPWLSLVVADPQREGHSAAIVEGPVEIVAVADTPADLDAANLTWAAVWLRLTATRLLSYTNRAAGNAGPT
jgi:Pyridoxamine 5'-phosphate oxidase